MTKETVYDFCVYDLLRLVSTLNSNTSLLSSLSFLGSYEALANVRATSPVYGNVARPIIIGHEQTFIVLICLFGRYWKS